MKRTILAGVMAAAALCGCEGVLGPEAGPAPVLAMAQSPQLEEPERPGYRWLGTQFEDLPVPAELTLDYDASYVSTSAHGPRVADLRYSGNTPSPMSRETSWLTSSSNRMLRTTRSEMPMTMSAKSV